MSINSPYFFSRTTSLTSPQGSPTPILSPTLRVTDLRGPCLSPSVQYWEEKEQRGSCLEEIWPVGSFANAFLSCYTSSMAPLFPIIPQCFRLKCTSRNTGPHSPITHVRLSPTMICYCQNNLIVLSF